MLISSGKSWKARGASHVSSFHEFHKIVNLVDHLECLKQHWILCFPVHVLSYLNCETVFCIFRAIFT